MKSLFTAFIAASLSFGVFAETKMCVITTDIDSEQTELFLDFTNEGDIDSVRLFKTITGGKIVSNDTHPVERVMADGVVASERSNRDIVILRTDKAFSPKKGGIIIMDYLYNGIKGTRRNYKLKLTRINNSFVLTTLEGAKVNRLLFKGNRAAVVGWIGIKDIFPEFK